MTSIVDCLNTGIDSPINTSRLKYEKLTKKEEHIAGEGCCPDCIGVLIKGAHRGGSMSFYCSLRGATFCHVLDWSRLSDRLDENLLFTRDIFSITLCSKIKHFSRDKIEDLITILLSMRYEDKKTRRRRRVARDRRDIEKSYYFQKLLDLCLRETSQYVR